MKKTTHTAKKNIQSKRTKDTTRGALAYHIAKSLVSVAAHPHTGHAIHRRHTSHGVLLVALLLTGVLLFNNLGTLHAYGLSNSGSQTVTVNVLGAAPTIGADITYPATNTTTKSAQVQVRGTCPPGLLVATYNNGVFAGSSLCDNDGFYTTLIQLGVGSNILQSQDYDGMNQPGPTTAQVQITREQEPVTTTTTTSTTIPTIAETPADIVPNPTPPAVQPAPQPAQNPCFDTSKTDSLDPTTPTIISQCITRSVLANDTITLPIRVTGGVAPYALSINWGDGTIDLKSVIDTEYHNYEHTYKNPGIINVALKTTDAKGTTSFLQTIVQVNGSATAGAPASTSTFSTITAGLNSVWTEAPVPLYWAAVMLVLGFWVGDIFQRVFAKNPHTGKRSSASRPRRRHA